MSSAWRASWRRAERGDAAALRAFVEPKEGYATGFSSRVRDGSGGLIRFSRLSTGLFILEGDEDDEGLRAAVLLSPSGTAFPVLSETLEGEPAIAELARLKGCPGAADYKPSACIGASTHVDALMAAFGWKADHHIDYVSMSSPPARHAFGAGVRRAMPSDLDALMPLAEAYERGEVLTPLHIYDPEACKANQARSLDRQVVYLAEAGGRVVARAQTNARGWSTDQIGGVYVVPEERRKGYGKAVVGALVDHIAKSGRSASLFVKKSNAAARFLYESLGFSVTNDYTVAYFR